MRTMPASATSRPRLLAKLLVVAGVLLSLALCFLPSPAHARSYEIPKVDIDATVAADGSLTVHETRRFSFDGSFGGVYWNIPVGTYEGREVRVAIDGVGVRRGDRMVALDRSDSEGDGTFQILEDGSKTQVKLFSAHKDEDVDFVITYTYTGVTSRWFDTSELYWKFVSDGWDMPSDHVTCRIHLPVPSDASFVPGETVRAWGHGVPSGHVEFEGQDVVYTVPGVGTAEFAEARVVFPEGWLPGMEPSSERRLEAILSQEQQWADEANAERAKAHARRVRNCVTMGVVALATAAFAAFRKRKHSQLQSYYYDDLYFRDLPSHDHPVVLASLLEFRERENAEVIGNLLAARGTNGMPTSLMRLADEGVVSLERVRDTDGTMQYRLVERGKVGRARKHDEQDKASKAIDRATFRLLFDVIAAVRPSRTTLDEPSSGHYVLLSDFETMAQERTTAYTNGWKAWGKAVAEAYEQRGFKTEIDPNATALLVMGIVDFVVAAVMGFVAYVNDLNVFLVLLFMALLVASGIWCIKVEVDTMYLHTPEALELMGKTEALKRWLCDFTRLEEAIPTDVTLWNELLVMATALGVSKEVLKQLKVKVPQLLDDPRFTSYGWYRRDDEEERKRRKSPMEALTQTIAAADAIAYPHRYSTSDDGYDSSDYSSGSGSGGGFSSGGGGGYGGGGGGGAF